MYTVRTIPYKIIIILFVAFCSCRNIRYSFTGVTIPPEVQTVSIQYFPNQAPIVQPTLSQVFTEAMKDKFISQTNLVLVSRTGDLSFEGAITGYTTKPMAIQGNETAALNRLTITVKVTFTNTKVEGQDFDKVFSAYSDYDSSKSLDAVEDELIRDIVDQLVENIFNEALVNW